jgi:hypothetical protein
MNVCWKALYQHEQLVLGRKEYKQKKPGKQKAVYGETKGQTPIIVPGDERNTQTIHTNRR